MLITFLLCLFFCGCNFDTYYGKRPFDYDNAIWICENPCGWFLIDHNEDEYYNPKGEIEIDEKKIRIQLFFIHETEYVILSDGLGADTFGECIFSPQKLIIKVDKEDDAIFEGKYDELIFIRTPDVTIEK